MILPGKFSQITNEVQESNVYDVRQNLKTFHREENTDEYCVVFRVEKAMKSCKLNEDTNTLIRGKYEKFYIRGWRFSTSRHTRIIPRIG